MASAEASASLRYGRSRPCVVHEGPFWWGSLFPIPSCHILVRTPEDARCYCYIRSQSTRAWGLGTLGELLEASIAQVTARLLLWNMGLGVACSRSWCSKATSLLVGRWAGLDFEEQLPTSPPPIRKEHQQLTGICEDPCSHWPQ